MSSICLYFFYYRTRSGSNNGEGHSMMNSSKVGGPSLDQIIHRKKKSVSVLNPLLSSICLWKTIIAFPFSSPFLHL